MWIFGLLMLTIYLGANGYLYWRLLSLLESTPMVVKVLFSLLFWVVALLLFVSIALRNVPLPAVVARAMFAVGSVWMVFLLYATLLMLLFDLLHRLIPMLHYGPYIALFITLIIMAGGYLNYRHPRVRLVEIESERVGSPLRLVAISDVHLGHGTTRRDLARYVDMINEQHADVVVVAGDLIDNSIEPVRRERMEEELARVNAPLGVLVVPGNHEYISGMDAYCRWVTKSGLTLVRDSLVALSEDVVVVGRDDRSNTERRSLESLVAGVGDGRFMVVVDHQPTAIDESVDLGADLHLSGHTHRGQVWPISWLTDAIYEQSHGHRLRGGCHVVVSQGLSLWGPPFRIGSQSEIYVIDIKPMG